MNTTKDNTMNTTTTPADDYDARRAGDMLDSLLASTGTDPFAVPDTLRAFYDGTTDTDAAQRIMTAGGTIEGSGERALRAVIMRAVHARPLVHPHTGDVYARSDSERVAFDTALHGGMYTDAEAALRAQTVPLAMAARLRGWPYLLGLHVERLRMAREAKANADARAAGEARSRREHTDPLTGEYDLHTYGTVTNRTAVRDAPTDPYGAGAWSTRTTPLMAGFIGHELYEQLRTARPDLAAAAAAEASRMLRDAGLIESD